jgi:hypothetical protein
MLATVEEHRNRVFWQSMTRGYNWEDLLDSSFVKFSAVCKDTDFLTGKETYSQLRIAVDEAWKQFGNRGRKMPTIGSHYQRTGKDTGD